jgi:2'-5' RNA ligase
MKDEVNEASSSEDSSSILHPLSFIPHPSTWRVFCAIEFPDEVSARASDHINRLRKQFPNVPAAWNRDGGFHLTLKFIGEIPRGRVERLSLAAKRATSNLSSFNLTVTGAGAFPKKGSPRVLWLGIDDRTGQLAKLHARLEQECALEDFTKGDRAFHPHLTIARLRKPAGARELATAHAEMGFTAVKVTITELLVVRSELNSAGSKYTTISRPSLVRV